MKFSGLYLLLLMLVLSLGANAQDLKYSRVKGTVTDVNGALISNVVINAKDANGKIYVGKVRTGDTDYEIALPKGIYTISFVRSPFRTVELKGFQTGYDLIQNLDICLVCGEGCEEIQDIAVPEKIEPLEEPDDRGSAPKKPFAK